jgi:excisionase family DNA binding protein
MTLVERLKSQKKALNVREVAELFGVTPQHLYKMAASGRIPSFRVSGAVRFDPESVASWLEEKQVPVPVTSRGRVRGVAA